MFYAGDADPLLTGCVRPLVNSLRSDGTLAGFFFLRYWVEGAHIRLRLLPARGVPRTEVSDRVEAAVSDFLGEHPSVEPVAKLDNNTAQALFLAEYDRADWDRAYGSAAMPLRQNNTHRQVRYEPEYARYGGAEGVKLSEQHFEVSSDLTLYLLATRRPKPGAKLGLSAQLGLALCLEFLGTATRVVDFLSRYQRFWENTYLSEADKNHVDYDATFVESASHFASLTARAFAQAGATSTSSWHRHCRSLKTHIDGLIATDRLTWGGVTPPAPAEFLLQSYLHMTNNRLGLTIGEEIHVAHLLRSALSLHHRP